MADIDTSTPISPIFPRRSTRKIDEEERAKDGRQRRQQQEKFRSSTPTRTKNTEDKPDDGQPRIDEYV